MTARSGPSSRTLASPRQVAALASPIRQALVDATAASGPCSIAELALQLGRPASGLYHHVQALVSAGVLIRRQPTRAAGAGRPAVRFDVPGRPMRIRYAPEQASTRGPMRKLVGAMTRLAAREFAEAYRSGVRVTGPARELWASRVEAWLTAAQLERANALLTELISLFSAARRPPTSRARLHSLVFVLAPRARRARPALPPRRRG